MRPWPLLFYVAKQKVFRVELLASGSCGGTLQEMIAQAKSDFSISIGSLQGTKRRRHVP